MTTAPLQPTPSPSPQADASARLDTLFSAPSAARRSYGYRLVGVAACLALSAGAVVFERLGSPARMPLFLFFAGLSLLAVLLPASGPRGRRVGLTPTVALAALLLLPPLAALLPLLLANTAHALSRDTPLLRRGGHERGLWVALAALTAGLVQAALHGLRPMDIPRAPLDLAQVTLTYGFVYVLGGLSGLGKYREAGRAARSHAWAAWRLEAVTLALTAPVAVLMALSYPALGLSGVGGAAGPCSR